MNESQHDPESNNITSLSTDIHDARQVYMQDSQHGQRGNKIQLSSSEPYEARSKYTNGSQRGQAKNYLQSSSPGVYYSRGEYNDLLDELVILYGSHISYVLSNLPVYPDYGHKKHLTANIQLSLQRQEQVRRVLMQMNSNHTLIEQTQYLRFVVRDANNQLQEIRRYVQAIELDNH